LAREGYMKKTFFLLIFLTFSIVTFACGNGSTFSPDKSAPPLNRGGVYTSGKWKASFDNAREACERSVIFRCEYLEITDSSNGAAKKIKDEVASMCRTAILNATAICSANREWYYSNFGKPGYTITHVKIRCKSALTGRDLVEFRFYCPAAVKGGKFCDPLSKGGADSCPQIPETTIP